MSEVEHFAATSGGEDNLTDFLYIIKKDGTVWRMVPNAPYDDDAKTLNGWRFVGITPDQRSYHFTP